MSMHDFTMTSITGEPVGLRKYTGRFSLIVNVASHCGATPQYAGLRTLHHSIEDLNVLAFPCNQFGQQEPSTNAEILRFATERYGVTFPMFAKIEVNGPGAAPLYQWLKEQQPGSGDSPDIGWNFEKFLIDPKGKAVARWSTRTTPEQIAPEVAKYR